MVAVHHLLVLGPVRTRNTFLSTQQTPAWNLSFLWADIKISNIKDARTKVMGSLGMWHTLSWIGYAA